uniref:Uncharacterized protein n=1 Tax=Ditylenchus dipsaci TaxID=166011 RepID=A0A915EJY0_9BILA
MQCLQLVVYIKCFQVVVYSCASKWSSTTVPQVVVYMQCFQVIVYMQCLSVLQVVVYNSASSGRQCLERSSTPVPPSGRLHTVRLQVVVFILCFQVCFKWSSTQVPQVVIYTSAPSGRLHAVPPSGRLHQVSPSGVKSNAFKWSSTSIASKLSSTSSVP